ncbi:MAG: response regulator [Trichloromonadaceae bacterium]
MSKKLLLADDSITIQKVIGITFANEDYSLCVVDNGDAALEKARTEQPDLILADVFMPGKNGYELCAAIKAEVGLQQIPVLLLAGTFEPFDEAKARKAGADGWIAKPFESQALIDRVEELLARPRTPVVAAAPAPAAAPAVESVVAPAALMAAVLAVEDEDNEPDLWAELGPVEASFIDVPEAPAAQTPVEAPAVEADDLDADGGIDDLWGEVSLGEEDLIPVAAAATPEDIWADLDVPAAAPMVEASQPATTAADLWDDLPTPAETVPASAGSVLEEEEIFLTLEDEDETADLLEPGADDAEEEEAFIFVEAEDLAQDLTVAATQPMEDATTFFAAEPAEEELLELDDSDIMVLDDVDIVEEDELELLDDSLEELVAVDGDTEMVEPARPADGFEDLVLGDLPTLADAELELLDDAPKAAETLPAAGEEPLALEDAFDDLLLGDLSPVTALPAEVTEEPASLLVDSQMDESPLWDVVEPALDELVEVEPEPAAETAAAAPPVAPVVPLAPALTAAAAEAQVQGLSEADLTRIVERVAGEVIEKLAGTILERLAWEVVPDLAETLIREEIRKIRDNVV